MRKLTKKDYDMLAQSLGGRHVGTPPNYVNEKAKWECSLCDEQFSRSYKNVRDVGYLLCKDCGSKQRTKKIRLTIDDYYNLAFSLGGTCLEAEAPLNCCTKVKWSCSKCGKSFERPYNNVSNTKHLSCAKCSAEQSIRKRRLSKDDYHDLALSLHGKFLETHAPTSNQIKVKWGCSECGDTVSRCYTSVMASESLVCLSCSKAITKGERYAGDYLSMIHIQYEMQKRFNDLRGIGGHKLSYDFYLPRFNILIEIQGQQHFNAVKHFGGEKKLKRQQQHDELKRDYAKNNGYYLVEIPYNCLLSNKENQKTIKKLLVQAL